MRNQAPMAGTISAWRVTCAFVAAPVSAAVLFAATVVVLAIRTLSLKGAAAMGLAYGVVALIYFALLPTLFLGLPLFLLLRRRLRAELGWAIMVGTLLGAGPYGLMTLLPLFLYGDRVSNAQQALQSSVTWVGAAALFGAFGGWVFWLVLTGGPHSDPRGRP